MQFIGAQPALALAPDVIVCCGVAAAGLQALTQHCGPCCVMKG
jgi:hypothetical protein